MTEETPKTGRIWRRWVWFGVPTAGAAAAFIAGIIFWGGFNTAVVATNEMGFCVSCHEMKNYVYEGNYVTSVHYQNRSGVQATCADCHVPDPWVHKMVRKVEATRELYAKAIGRINTPEKYEAERLRLAMNVWNSMKRTDSRECRNCHTIESMAPQFQAPRARQQHLTAMESGQTCIDCHKGIAHGRNTRDRLDEDALEALEAPILAHIKVVPQSYRDGLAYITQVEAEAVEQAAAEARAAEESVQARVDAAVERALAAAAEDSVAVGAAAEGAIDWSDVPATQVGLFYPGQTPWEWVLNGRDHGGARAFMRAGDQCSTCHANEIPAIGSKMLREEATEPTPIPGKRGSVDLAVQAAHDNENLYLRFRWQAADHAPVPFVDGGKMDPENPVKLAMTVVGAGVEFATQAGCWASCHMDSYSMPNHPESLGDLDALLGGKGYVQKYIPDSRTDIELRGRDRPVGGWDLLRDAAELQAFLEGDTFMDLTRVNAEGQATRGYLLERRHDDTGSPVEGAAVLVGDTWEMTITRPLAASGPGQIAIEPGMTYMIGLALHDDYSTARFHHVSLDLRLGLDDPAANINAVAR